MGGRDEREDVFAFQLFWAAESGRQGALEDDEVRDGGAGGEVFASTKNNLGGGGVGVRRGRGGDDQVGITRVDGAAYE